MPVFDGSMLTTLLGHIPMLLEHVSSLPAGSPVKGAFLDAIIQMLTSALSNPQLQAWALALIMKLISGGGA